MTKSTRDWILFPYKAISPISFLLGLILMVIARRIFLLSFTTGIIILVAGTAVFYVLLYGLRSVLGRMYPEPAVRPSQKTGSDRNETDNHYHEKNMSLPSGVPYLYRDKIDDNDVAITQDYIEYNGKHLDFRDLTGIRFGTSVMSINNLERTQHIVHLTRERIFHDDGYLPPKSAIPIVIELSDGELTPSHVSLRHHDQYGEITQALLKTAVLPLADKMLHEFHDKKPIRFGDLVLNQDGISHPKKGLVRWDEYRGFAFSNGQVIITSSARALIGVKQYSLSLKDTWNAVVLPVVLDGIVRKES